MSDGPVTLDEARRRSNRGGPNASDMPDISKADASRWLGTEPEPLRFTVDGLVPEGMVTLLVAEGGAGKSILCQIGGTCIPSGLHFLGKNTTSGSAAGVFAEDPEPVLHLRQDRINTALGVDLENLSGRWFPQSYFGLDAVLWCRGERTRFFGTLESQLRQIDELRFLAIDNTALVYSGDESGRVEVTAFVNLLNGLADRLRLGIVLTTHQSKSRDSSALRAASGSTAWINACRSVLLLENGDEPDMATLTLIKANHAKPGEKIPLRWENGVLLPQAPPDSLTARIRNRQIDRLIFDRVHERWEANYPLSPTPSQAHRYLPKALAAGSDYRAKELKEAMNMHLNAGNLKMDQRTTRTPMGLKVARLPEHLRERLSTA